MKRICEALVLFIGTLGWWGFVYPELCLTEETFEQEYEEEQPGESEETDVIESFTDNKSGGVKEEIKSGSLKKESRTDGTKEDMAEKNKEKPWAISGEIRIKSRLMEYVYQG